MSARAAALAAVAVALLALGPAACDEPASPADEAPPAQDAVRAPQAGAGPASDAAPLAADDPADDPARPPGAVWQTVEELRADAAAERHPSDGGGRLRFATPPEPVQAGGQRRFEFVYEVGELGIAEGGSVEFLAPVSWGWSPAWYAPDAPLDAGPPGRISIEPLEGVTWTPRGRLGERCIVLVEGRALAPGERVRFTFGAGPAGARVDRYAERTPALLLRVDGDGDQVPDLVADPPEFDVLAGPPAQLVVHLPSSVPLGEPARLDLAVLDALGNAAPVFEGELRFPEAPAALGLPAAVTLGPDDRARASLTLTPAAEGLYRLLVEGDGGLLALSNPMLVAPGAERVLWADLHGHSGLSDGTGTPEAYLRYAREVAGLDVVALTDHDHWGLPFLDTRPDLVERLREAARAAHEPGRFVSLFGFEWTSWIHGHRHVLAFGPPEELPWLSSLDPDYEHPRQLWDALRGRPVRTFAHHTSGAPVPTNWDVPPDPELEPVVEIVSVHGSSESADTPSPVARSRSGHYVRDALARGYRLGFVGSGDSHDGHPGMAHLAAGQGGLAALLGAEHTRDSVRAALDARRCYATSGARILLRASLAGQRMGAAFPAPDGTAPLVVLVHGTAPVRAVDVVRGVETVATREYDEPTFDLVERFDLEQLAAGESVYVRVRQADGHSAWCSPFFLE